MSTGNSANTREDPNVRRLVTELKGLRPRGIKSSYDFYEAPALLWHLGRGNADVALRFFEQLPRMKIKEIDAALASLGFMSPDLSVEDRMSEFAVLVERETPTVRRWTDEGFRLIARMVMDWSAEEGHDHPMVHVVLTPMGVEGVGVSVACIAEPGTTMLRPEVRSNEGVLPWVEPPVEGADLRPPVIFKAAVEARFPDADQMGRFVEVFCLGNDEARFQLEICPGVMPSYKSVTLWSKKGCEVRWESTDPAEEQIAY